VALNQKQKEECGNVMVKAVFISVNKITDEVSRMVQGMPELVDRLEILPFGCL
jgi:hypothetical protein